MQTKQGRPVKGALSTYPKKLRDLIYKLRKNNQGWGSISILVELEEKYSYTKNQLPSADAVHRYLKQQGLVKERLPSEPLPSNIITKKGKGAHYLWEMDAQGAIATPQLGCSAMINLKDNDSKVYCMAFPVVVKNTMSQPKTIHYLWALRLAFSEFGRPKVIQVDKDSVFIDNTSKSPFPTRIHLYLIGLGIELSFIKLPPPLKQSIVERSHQTLDNQVTKGKSYKNWKALFNRTNERRKILNEKYPSRSFNKQAPLQANPKAKHSGRAYSIEKEEQLLDIKRVYSYLSKCCWYRKVSKGKTVSLASNVYYLKNAKPFSQVQITFCNRAKKLIFRDVKEQILAKQPIKNISKQTLMGDTTKKLISMKKKLYRARDFPL